MTNITFVKSQKEYIQYSRVFVNKHHYVSTNNVKHHKEFQNFTSLTFLYICQISRYCMGNITKRLGFSFNNGSILGSNGTGALLAKEVPATFWLDSTFDSLITSCWSFPAVCISSPMDILRTLPALTAVRILRGLCCNSY